MEIKCEPVFLCCMDDQIPTVLLYDGRRYLLEKNDIQEQKPVVKKNEDLNKTEDLKRLVIERDNSEQPLILGKVIARVGSGTLIHENPLKEMMELKRKNRLTALNMAGVLRKYHKNLKASTIAVYRSGYQSHINKKKNADIRMNEPPTVYETVTEKNKEAIKKIVATLGDGAMFDEILKESNMTEYKLKLILNDPAMNIAKKYNGNGKEIYCFYPDE